MHPRVCLFTAYTNTPVPKSANKFGIVMCLRRYEEDLTKAKLNILCEVSVHGTNTVKEREYG